MDQSFSLNELEFLYSITHQCIFLNNHQLDNDTAITSDTRNSIVDENKVAMKCLRNSDPLFRMLPRILSKFWMPRFRLSVKVQGHISRAVLLRQFGAF